MFPSCFPVLLLLFFLSLSTIAAQVCYHFLVNIIGHLWFRSGRRRCWGALEIEKDKEQPEEGGGGGGGQGQQLLPSSVTWPLTLVSSSSSSSSSLMSFPLLPMRGSSCQPVCQYVCVRLLMCVCVRVCVVRQVPRLPSPSTHHESYPCVVTKRGGVEGQTRRRRRKGR